MNSKFLKEYLNKSLFIPNPISLENFINECETFGINISKQELEYYEKIELFFPLFRTDNYLENNLHNIDLKYLNHDTHYINFEFKRGNEKKLLDYLNENKIYSPTSDNFVPFDSFKDDFGNIIKDNYYSVFQIDFLNEIHEFFSYNSNYLLNTEKEYDFNESIESKINNFKNRFDENERKLNFLLSIQRFYFPLANKDFNNYIISEGLEWAIERRNFNTKDIFIKFDLSVDEILAFIEDYLNKFFKYMGITDNEYDWIYFWENVNVNYKNSLTGINKFGLFYLKISLMLKYFLIDYSIETNQELYYGKLSTFFEDIDKYEKLYFLINKLNLNYQPNMTVFVEGDSEEINIPKIFQWYFGYSPLSRGIEFINIHGVDTLKSTAKDIFEFKKLIIEIQREFKCECISKEYGIKLNNFLKKFNDFDIIFSNWSSFISYNLIKWQIIPFFVTDNEGKIDEFLNHGKILEFKDENYDIPNEWKYIWGISNNNSPLNGKDFELANFTNSEIKSALNKILSEKVGDEFEEILEKDVEIIRINGEGINQICDNRYASTIRENKKIIVNLLFENLINSLDTNLDIKLIDKPIFDLVQKINGIRKDYINPIDNISKKNFENFIEELLIR